MPEPERPAAAVNRRWLLARRPQGMITRDDFQWDEAEVPVAGEGEIVVQNLWLSVDPTQRGWISGDTYMPAVKIGEVVRSFAAGRVVASNLPRFAVGDLVQGLFGWQDYTVAAPGRESAPSRLPAGVPIETALSVLGLTGLTAYFGLLDVGRPTAGETVVVSGAAGATGSAVGQIAKIKGCKVVGIAGGADKCRYLLDLGFDAAIDYKAEDVAARLRALCPDGIDVYFDNVGGAILDAALARLAMRGRVVICGAIARYNESNAQAAGPKNYMNLLLKRGRMEGFLIFDYLPRAREAIADLSAWMAEGKLKDRVDIAHGLEHAPDTLARLFRGDNLGKQLLHIAD